MNFHNQRAHALLSASGAERWLACTPSAREEDNFPEETSTYAEEGTCAHELSEYRLREKLKWEPDPKVLEKVQSSEYYCESMEEYVDNYTNRVIEIYHSVLAQDPTAVIFLEQKLDYSHWVPEGYGTGDVTIIGAGMIIIVDLKYGKGIPKSAEWNPQLMLYGLGGVRKYDVLYDIQKVILIIDQPRLDTLSEWSLTKDSLIKWAEDEVIHKASLAWEGAGEYVAGTHCTFCKVAPKCRALAEHNLRLALMEFKQPNIMTDDEIGEVLHRLPDLTSWANKVKDYAEDQAINKGNIVKGWKLVHGTAKRKIIEPEKVQLILDLEGYNLDDVAPRKINGITALDKLVGKKHLQTLIGKYIIKPEGKATLVPESDKREAIKTKLTASEEFGALE